MRSTRPIDSPHEPHGQASVKQGVDITTLDSLHLYIDVLVQSDALAALFFGHLLREPWPPPRGWL
jgi:hypothetical protein